MRILRHLVACSLVTLITQAPVQAASGHDTDSSLERLRLQDSMLGEIAYRLTTANAALCQNVLPASGTVLHARNQYSQRVAARATVLFGFAAPVAIAAIVPGGPADRAGLHPGDAVLSVSGIQPPPEDGDDKPDTLVRDRFEQRLADLPPAEPMVWRVIRSGQELTFSLDPQPACRVRFEVVPGQKLVARNTGELIQLSAGYLELLGSDLFAAVVAHELAHSVLHHRTRLVAAGVSKGLLAEFGRNGRLNRQIEREADLISVHLLRNAGYDPAAAVRLWDQYGGRISGGLLRSRTHDAPSERARRLRAEIAGISIAAPIPYAPPLLQTRDQPLN